MNQLKRYSILTTKRMLTCYLLKIILIVYMDDMKLSIDQLLRQKKVQRIIQQGQVNSTQHYKAHATLYTHTHLSKQDTTLLRVHEYIQQQ